MQFIDTHTHLFLSQFHEDSDQVIKRALDAGVSHMLLPNVDTSTIDDMFSLSKKYQQVCFPMVGLHPTSVDQHYLMKMASIEKRINESVVAIGEIGIDLYWDKTWYQQQVDAFKYQIALAREHDLPIVIHARESFSEIFEVLDSIDLSGVTGVFHSFTGTLEEAQKILAYKKFKLGIGGILTFKNARLDEVVHQIDLKHIVLETDSPYLAPVPYRGKRNESSYLVNIAEKLAEIKDTTLEEVAKITTGNAKELFHLE